jgi:hypothetical protein
MAPTRRKEHNTKKILNTFLQIQKLYMIFRKNLDFCLVLFFLYVCSQMLHIKSKIFATCFLKKY